MPHFVHYWANRPQSQQTLSNGVTLSRWASPAGSHGDNILPTELTGQPPYVARLDLKAGWRFPPKGKMLWVDQDVMYIFMTGTVWCESCKGGRQVFGKGDLFFSEKRRLHGHFTNSGLDTAVVMIATAVSFNYHTSWLDSPLRGGQHVLNFPANGWGPSGLGRPVESATCWRSGKVMIHDWLGQTQMPNVMSVLMHRDCMIPCHTHVGGATYFVLGGELKIKGDGTQRNTTFQAGDVRWVRDGFIYGPEYSDVQAQMVVLGLPGAVTPGRCRR